MSPQVYLFGQTALSLALNMTHHVHRTATTEIELYYGHHSF